MRQLRHGLAHGVLGAAVAFEVGAGRGQRQHLGQGQRQGFEDYCIAGRPQVDVLAPAVALERNPCQQPDPVDAGPQVMLNPCLFSRPPASQAPHVSVRRIRLAASAQPVEGLLQQAFSRHVAPAELHGCQMDWRPGLKGTRRIHEVHGLWLERLKQCRDNPNPHLGAVVQFTGCAAKSRVDDAEDRFPHLSLGLGGCILPRVSSQCPHRILAQGTKSAQCSGIQSSSQHGLRATLPALQVYRRHVDGRHPNGKGRRR